MLKTIQKSKIILFALILIMLMAPLCIATESVPVTTNETTSDSSAVDNLADLTYNFISSDVYKFDDKVVVDSIVDGNVFVFGNEVTISGEIGGDVFVVGNQIKFTDTAYIHGSIFIVGNEIKFDGICYDIYGLSSIFTIESNAIIARDLKLAGETININGQVKRNAYLYTNKLNFDENSQDLIGGELTYCSTSETSIPEGAVIGKVTYVPITKPETEAKTISIVEIIMSSVKKVIASILYAFVAILLILWVAPNFKEKASELFKTKTPLALGIGFLTTAITLIGSVILFFITAMLGLGIGISAAAITIWILALTISKTVFGIGVAKIITDKINKQGNIFFVLFTLLTVLVIEIIGFIPFIGGLAGLVVNMIGLGIIVLNLIKKK